jgi:hypothetical protein
MKQNFVRTKVIILISILLISSFGLFVTGQFNFGDNEVEMKVITDNGPVKKTWEPPAYQTTSRATGPLKDSNIQNDGDSVSGYFLGKINPDFSNDYSTLDNYLDHTDLGAANAKDKPAFPGSTDIVYDLTIGARNIRDDNGNDGDDVLYINYIGVDLDTVQVRDEATWDWSNTATPFGEIAGSVGNIVNTSDLNWVVNELTINNLPAGDYNSNYNHANARWPISNNNTVTNENYEATSGATGTVNNVWIPEVFNNSVDNEWMDVFQDTYLNDTPDNPATPNIEYRDLIKIDTGDKVFEGFSLDVLPDAKPGVYRFPVSIEYKNNTHSPLPPTGQEAGLTANMNLHNSGSFGDFQPYFWVPYNLSTNQIITDLTDENMDPNIFDTNENCSFIKDEVYLIANERDDLDGLNSWEPIPDNSTSNLRKWDLSEYFDDDGDNFDGGVTGNPDTDRYNYAVWPAGADNFQTDWNNNRHLLASDNGGANPYETGTFPRGYPLPDWDYGFLTSGLTADDDGNGTWQYPGRSGDWAGYEGDVVWQTTIETYWVQITIFSGSASQFSDMFNGDRGLIMAPASAASDTYVTDGDTFEEFQVTISNGEYIHYANTFDFNYTDIVATLDIQPHEQYFEVQGSPIARVSFMTDTPRDLKFRIASEPDTPPGYYYFKLNWTYTKVYYVEMGTNDPRNDVTVMASETTMVEYFVEFSPDLAVKDAKLAAQPGMRALNPRFVIDTGTNKTSINFTIENTGNVELIADAQYIENSNYYDSKFGDVGMYIAGIELLGSPYYEEDEINNPNLYLDIEPIIIPSVAVGSSIDIEVPVKIGHNWDNLPGIYRVHLNYRGFYFDPGLFTPASQFVYTEIRWEPDGGAKDKSYSYRDTNGDGDIDWPGDSRDETDGIYTDIEIENFDPATRELAIKTFYIDNVENGVITQGSTSAEVSIVFENNNSFDMMNLDVMLAIGGNYFSKFSHYDIDQEGKSDDLLTVHVDQLLIGETLMANFTINGVDRLTPTGEHRLPINYVYDFYELPGFMSSYGIVWDDVGGRFRGFIDEEANGAKDGSDDNELMDEYNYDGGYLAVEVVEDNLLDVIAVQNIVMGDQLDLGDKIRNNDIQIDLTSREYVKYTQIEAYLETTVPNPMGGADLQILQNPITLDNMRIEGVFDDPADDELDATGGTNSVIFNVDLVEDDAIAMGGVFPFNMTIIATNDDTNTRATYIIPVNIRVMPVDPILMIADVDVGTDGISPGDDFSMVVTLNNVGDDVAREIYITLSNDWYMDDPFFLVDEFVSSISAIEMQDSDQDCIDCDISSSLYKRVPNSTNLADLDIDETTDIVDSERVLMSPAAKISRLYIEEIQPGTSMQVTFQMRADTHMQKGKAYEELILLEFRDSYGNIYDWTRGPPYTDDMAYSITLVTEKNDKWPKTTTEEIEEKAAEQYEAARMAYLAGIAILIIIIILLLRRRRQGRGRGRV